MPTEAKAIDSDPFPIDFRRLCMIAETEEEKTYFLEFFFKTAEDILAEMKKASCRSDPLLWKNAAHKLRGAAANIGTVSLESLCLESERITWTGSKFRDVLLQKMEEEIVRIKKFAAEKRPVVPVPERIS